MPFLELHVTGINELQDGFEEWKVRVGEAALEWVTKGGEIVANEAKKVFAGGSSQAAWQGPNFPVPTSHSGFLRNSIGTQNIREFPGGASSETGPRTIYGRRIELGYTGRGFFPYYTTRPFPYLKPGAEKAMPQLTELFVSLMREAGE
jgi:hypothetical protein